MDPTGIAIERVEQWITYPDPTDDQRVQGIAMVISHLAEQTGRLPLCDTREPHHLSLQDWPTTSTPSRTNCSATWRAER